LSVAVNAISPMGPSGRNGVLTVHLCVGVHFCSPAETETETEVKTEQWEREDDSSF
jgi:hypothetical protein